MRDRLLGTAAAQAEMAGAAFSERHPPLGNAATAVGASLRLTTLAGQPAGFPFRLKAFLIDYIIGAVVVMIVIWSMSLFSPPLPLETLIYAALGGIALTTILNQIVLTCLRGQTIGKMMLAIKLVKRDGTPPAVSQVVGRYVLGYFISALPLGLGFLWSLWDSDQMAWHDKLFSTSVIRIETP
jgi:uncharacterized RDD family membrane protein YckC